MDKYTILLVDDEEEVIQAIIRRVGIFCSRICR